MLHNPNFRAAGGDSVGQRSYTVTEVPSEHFRSTDFPFIVRFYGRDAHKRMLQGEPFYLHSKDAALHSGQHWLETGERIAA